MSGCWRIGLRMIKFETTGIFVTGNVQDIRNGLDTYFGAQHYNGHLYFMTDLYTPTTGIEPARPTIDYDTAEEFHRWLGEWLIRNWPEDD
jgi:hypothetical protein